jgi:hypothetical protein
MTDAAYAVGASRPCSAAAPSLSVALVGDSEGRPGLVPMGTPNPASP